MSTLEIILGAVLIAVSLFLIVAVLMQSGKEKGISGTIAGGAETFFGKSKGRSIDKKLSVLTAVIAVLFVVVVLTVYVMQDTTDTSGIRSSYDGTEAVTTVADDTADTALVTEGAAVTDGSDTAEAAADTTETVADTTEAVADTTEAVADTAN